MDGIEFIEYATNRPQALGQVLESLGFLPVARHRSREITLYRQGASASSKPTIVTVAFRVRDALKAHTRCLDLGAWDMQSHARAMECTYRPYAAPAAAVSTS
jgi:4-hydroxyphenylpyruvate dioxygenase